MDLAPLVPENRNSSSYPCRTLPLSRLGARCQGSMARQLTFAKGWIDANAEWLERLHYEPINQKKVKDAPGAAKR